MKFIATELQGAYIVKLELIKDNRGFFARSFCQKEFEQHKLESRFVQCNVSWNKEKAILRGMHYQVAPYEEVKLIRCTRGSIYDVIIDLRPDSSTYCKWTGVELKARDYSMLYVPKGFAHGYQTLEPDTEVLYFVSAYYTLTHERGVRWNAPTFKIKWSLPKPILSTKDQSHPNFKL